MVITFKRFRRNFVQLLNQPNSPKISQIYPSIPDFNGSTWIRILERKVEQTLVFLLDFSNSFRFSLLGRRNFEQMHAYSKDVGNIFQFYIIVQYFPACDVCSRYLIFTNGSTGDSHIIFRKQQTNFKLQFFFQCSVTTGDNGTLLGCLSVCLSSRLFQPSGT